MILNQTPFQYTQNPAHFYLCANGQAEAVMDVITHQNTICSKGVFELLKQRFIFKTQQQEVSSRALNGEVAIVGHVLQLVAHKIS